VALFFTAISIIAWYDRHRHAFRVGKLGFQLSFPAYAFGLLKRELASDLLYLPLTKKTKQNTEFFL
jgi:hypothetical protein